MSLPSSFQYFISSMAGQFERTPIRIIPDGNVSPAMNSSLQVTFPNDAIIDLNTLSMVATLKSSNAIDADATIVVPNSALLFRQKMWSLNGNIVAGAGNNHHGQVYEALRRCSVGTDFARSHADEYARVELCDKDGKFQGSEALTVAGKRIHIDEWGTLQDSPNGSSFDTSIYGVLRLHLQLAGENIMMCIQNTGIAADQALGWELANVEFRVDVLKAPSVYDDLILQRLQSGMTVDTCFPDIVSQISANNANVRFNVSSQSLNYLGFAPLMSEYLLPTRIQGATAGAATAVSSQYGPNYSRYRLQNTANAVPAIDSTAETYYLQINGKSYPAWGNNAMVDGVTQTKETFCGQDVNGRNLLFAGLVQPDGTVGRDVTYRRENFLRENAIIVHRLCVDEAHKSPMRMMSGINTAGQNAQLALNTQGWSTSDYVLLFGATTTTLSASAGQAVAVTY